MTGSGDFALRPLGPDRKVLGRRQHDSPKRYRCLGRQGNTGLTTSDARWQQWLCANAAFAVLDRVGMENDITRSLYAATVEAGMEAVKVKSGKDNKEERSLSNSCVKEKMPAISDVSHDIAVPVQQTITWRRI